jgi:TPR repeat protein
MLYEKGEGVGRTLRRSTVRFRQARETRRSMMEALTK